MDIIRLDLGDQNYSVM